MTKYRMLGCSKPCCNKQHFGETSVPNSATSDHIHSSSCAGQPNKKCMFQHLQRLFKQNLQQRFSINDAQTSFVQCNHITNSQTVFPSKLNSN